jgi:YVTN family beta-propeller protein
VRIQLHSVRLSLLLLALAAACASLPAQTQPQAQPIGMVAVGKSPFALAVPSNQQAVVVNLFPEGDPNSPSTWTNTKLVDLSSRTVTSQLRVGTRLVAVAVAGTHALVVNEDQDFVIVVDLITARELTRIGVGSRPSNVIVASTQLAIATNGTSGDLSFINLQTNTVSGSPVKVGTDPRAVAVHPAGQYAYVALGGDNAVGVVDLRSYTKVATVGVGKNPAAIAITRDGRRAVVANLTNNTVSILNTENPAAPSVISTPTGTTQIPVGVQPSALEISPDGKTAYVANLGSNFFTAVDIGKLAVAGVVNVQRTDPSNSLQRISSPTSGLRIAPDGTRLLVTEFRDASMLLIYDLNNMPLSPAPDIEVPGEPRASIYMDVNASLGCPGYYTAEVALADKARSGMWGMEVALTAGARLLQGGFNLGGGFTANGGQPLGFGAFNITNAANEPQTVTITVQAQALPTAGYSAGNLGLSVQLYKPQADGSRTPAGQGASGKPPLSVSTTVNPGFYVVEIKSLPGSPAGTFTMALGTQFVGRPGGAFQGGVVVGGYATRDANGNSTVGFGGFCISEAQTVTIRTLSGPSYGDTGSGDLVLTLKDRDGQPIRSINNAIPTSGGVTLPDPPDMQGATPTIYVDVKAAGGGDGSSARPFRSITAAVSKARSGDVILVRAGRYSPSLTGEVIPIGSAGTNINPLQANVKVFGSGAATTILDAEQSAGSAGNANAFVIGAPNVRFAGFTVRGAQQFGVLVYQASGVRIDSNFCTSNGRDGIGAIAAPGLVVTGNVTVANQESGIVVSGASSGAASNPPAGCPASFGACIINNVANDNRSDGILGSQGGTLYILNNTTLNNGSSGIELNNRADPGQPANPALTGYIRNNTVSNNGGVQFAFAGTGILITEGGHAAEISGNQINNNRPYGIGIFLNATAALISKNRVVDTQYNGVLVRSTSTVTEISDNTVTTSGLSGLFIDDKSRVDKILRNSSTTNGTCTACTESKSGLAVLSGSQAGTVDANFFDRNAVGLEVATNSTVSSVTNSTFDSNDNGGIFIRSGCTLPSFSGNKVRSNRGEGAVQVETSTLTLANSEISGNVTGVNLYTNSTATIQSCQINSNKGSALSATGGSQATLTGTTISGNAGNQAVLAAGAGSSVRLNGGNAIVNNQGLGLNAQNGGAISCTGANTISGNTSGNVFGSVTGCQ